MADHNNRSVVLRQPRGVKIRGAVTALFAAALLAAAAAAQAPQQSTSAGPTEGAQTTTSKADAKKAKAAYQEGLGAEQRQDWDAAYASYSDAANWAPGDREYLLRRAIAKSRLVQAKVDAAERDAVSGRLDAARSEMLAASYMDPSNKVVQERIAELTAAEPGQVREIAEPKLAGEPQLAYLPGNRSFDYRGDTQGAYEQLAAQFGVEVAFDIDIHSRTVRLQLSDVNFPTAARLLGDMTGTFWRPLTSRLFFVTDNTPPKRKEYDASVVRTILLPASETPEQMTEILRTVREIAGITRSDLDTQSRTMTLRASPQAIAVAGDLVDNLEQPTGEVILEIEILEVDRNYAQQLGITPPQTAKAFTISTQQVQEAEQSQEGLLNVLQQVFGTSSLPPVVAFGGGMTTYFATLPGAAANFGEMLSLVRHGRRVLLRAQDGQPATFFVGDRIPVSLMSFSASLTAGTLNSTAATTNPLTNYTVGNSPAFVTAASLRGNNIDDLIVANSADNTVSVLLGNGDGTFGTQTTFPTGATPVSIATGQFNASTTASNSDEFLDAAVANNAANTVSILLGNGDGTFQARRDLPTGRAPVSVVAADFHDSTGTGFFDLAVANQADNTISIFQGNGDGTFRAPTLIQLPAGFSPSALAAADLNGDGHTDLVVADEGSNAISVFLGNGDGTFQRRTDYPTGIAPVSVAFGDFNHDGAEDIAVANSGSDSVTVYYNQINTSNSLPLGTFVPGATRDFAAGNGPTSIAVADYNVDGLTDIAVSDRTDNAVTVLFNEGNGLFTPVPEIPVGTAPASIVTADFNGDGLPDAATADSGSAQATVIINSTTLLGNSSFNSNETPFPGVQYLDVGLKVKATPRIHPDNDVTLQLNFDISSLTSQSFNAIPVISNETVDQTVRLKPNETAAMAGFLEAQLTNAITGNPGIADIPGVGLLDQNQNAQQQDSELLILVTPRMVRLAPRKNHAIYAGQGSLEGEGAAAGPPLQAPLPALAEPPPPAAGARNGPPPEQQFPAPPAAGAPNGPPPER
jgi:type II secretory pathway component GspD/PulD (secretin)